VRRRLAHWIKAHVSVTALGAVLVVVVVALIVMNDRLATSGTKTCEPQQVGDIRTGPKPSMGLDVDAKAKLLLVLDHQTNDSRHDTVSVDLKALDASGQKTVAGELPENTNVGARLTRRPLASEPLAFDVVTNAVLSDDGRSIVVEACTVRPNRDTKPGRYATLVGVGGTGIVPENVPLEVTIRAGVISTTLIALMAAVLSLALTYYGTPLPSTPRPPEVPAGDPPPAAAPGPVVVTLALLTGLLGGLAAAYLAYDSDPTWGAERGKDTINLVIVTAAAASGAMSAAGAGAKAFNAFRSR
jgi:hypothetical protein